MNDLAKALPLLHPPREYAATVHVPTHFLGIVEGRVFQELLKKSGRPPPVLVLRRRRRGTHVTGTTYHDDPQVIMTLPIGCTWGQLASLTAHELAHYVSRSGHDTLWQDIMTELLVTEYAWEGGWPLNTSGVRYGSARADLHFETLLEFCPSHPAEPCSSRCGSHPPETREQGRR